MSGVKPMYLKQEHTQVLYFIVVLVHKPDGKKCFFLPSFPNQNSLQLISNNQNIKDHLISVLL